MSSEGPSKEIHEGLQLFTLSAFASPEIKQLFIRYMAAQAMSFDSSGWLPATVWFCGLLEGNDPPIAEVLESGVVPAFLLSLTEENFPKLQLKAAQALKYIASGTVEATKITVEQAGNPVHDALRHLLHSRDDKVLRYACCSLAVLSGCVTLKIKGLVRDSDLFHRLLELIEHPTLVVAALRTLGNIIEGDGYLIDSIISDKEILGRLRSCLYHFHVDARTEACWIFSHILAGNKQRIEAVFDEGLIETLINLVRNDIFAVMRAAVRAISNATYGATPEQIRFMVSKGWIETLCHLFCCRKSEIFQLCLESLDIILEAGNAEKSNVTGTDVNSYLERIEHIEGWGVLSELAQDYEERLFKKAYKLLLQYGHIEWKHYKKYLNEVGYAYYDV